MKMSQKPIVENKESTSDSFRKTDNRMLDIDESENETNTDLYDYVTWRKPQNLGLFYDKIGQAFTHKLVFIKIALYPFFGVYLNMPGHMYSALTSIFPMFWSLKFFWGFLSDSKPIFGKSRVYYMAIGWAISVVAYLVGTCLPYPEPYYKLVNGTLDQSQVNNPDAHSAGMMYVAVVAMGVFGVGITDLASDALVVDYVKRESPKYRGRSNIFAQMCSTFGGMILFVTMGTLLNSPPYGGKFDLSFTFRHMLIVYLVISVLGVLNSCFLTYEPESKKVKQSIMETVRNFWSFMEYRLFQRCAVMFLIVPALLHAKSSANVKIRKNWAKVEPFTGSIAAMFVALLVILGLYVLQKFFLHVSWRKLFTVSKIYIVIVSLFVEGLTCFDIIRLQYFYFSEELLGGVAHAVSGFIMLQVAAEVSEMGLEALTFGMLMTNWTVSASFGTMIGNIISAPFKVIDDDRYISDTINDRWAVFGSVASVLAVNLISVPIFLVLCPANKDQVQELKKTLGKSKFQAKLYAFFFCVGYLCIFLFNLLVIIPETRCSIIIGGKGC